MGHLPLIDSIHKNLSHALFKLTDISRPRISIGLVLSNDLTNFLLEFRSFSPHYSLNNK